MIPCLDSCTFIHGIDIFFAGKFAKMGRQTASQPHEYADYDSSNEESLTHDSNTTSKNNPELGQSYLLEVDNKVVMLAKTHLYMIITPARIPHSWVVLS